MSAGRAWLWGLLVVVVVLWTAREVVHFDFVAWDDPLYGGGLGLDSIDILEVALEVSKRYGFQLRADNEDNVRIFRSLATLAAHIAQNRTK